MLEEMLKENAQEETTEKIQFCEGAEGLFEIALESEMSWHNLVMETMTQEVIAIKNENAVLAGDTKKSFFQKVMEWAKDKLKKVMAFFSQLISKLIAQMGNIDKFIKANKDKLANNTRTVNVSIYKWDNNGVVEGTNKDMGTVVAVANKATAEIKSVSEICQEALKCKPSELTGKLASKYRSAERYEQDAIIKDGYDMLVKANGQIKSLAKTRDINKGVLETLQRQAQQGLTIPGEKANALKIRLTNIKNVNALMEKVSAVGISALQQVIADGLMICRKGLAQGRKEASANAKKEKQAEKQKKKDENKVYKADVVKVEESAGLFDLI